MQMTEKQVVAMIKTIIFDVDGTLLDTERIFMRAWREAGAEFGYTVGQEVLLQTRAVNGATARARFAAACGEDFPFEAVRARRVEIGEQLIGEADASQLLMPHAVQTLKQLREKGYTLAVASSTGQEKTVEHLEHAGLMEYFRVAVGGDMVERGKPEPDIFLLAARLCDTQPQHCVVVGDTPADVLAATAAGMPVILIPDQVPANEQTTALSRRVLSGLNQLADALEAEE